MASSLEYSNYNKELGISIKNKLYNQEDSSRLEELIYENISEYTPRREYAPPHSGILPPSDIPHPLPPAPPADGSTGGSNGEVKTAESVASKIVQAQQRIILGARANAVKVFRKMKHQFADPNKCYRELVQNSTDAGTERLTFEFRVHSILTGSSIQDYLNLFEKQIQAAGSSVEEARKGVEELLADSEGECTPLHQLLGEGYSYTQVGNFLFSKRLSTEYLDLVVNEWFIPLPPGLPQRWKEERITVDEFGFSEEIAQSIEDPLEKVRYYDQLVRINARIKNREKRYLLLMGREINDKKWNKLLQRRFAFVRELTAQPSEDQKVREDLQALAEEKPENYSARLEESAKELPLKNTLEYNFYTNFIFLSAPASELETLTKDSFKKIEIIAEDWGRGMTHSDRENFLKRIFATTKEDDLDQTGRFGVGFISVFALEPELVIVESARNGEAWEYHFLREREDALPGELYEPETPREKGTKITIVLPPKPAEEARQLIEKAKFHLHRDCRHKEVPIYVEGKKINEDFDLPNKIKVRFGKKGVEGVIALSESAVSHYTLENNRLVLESKDAILFSGLMPYDVLISSKYINYDIARENVERDANFSSIVRILKAQEDNLAGEVFQRLGRELSGERQVMETRAEEAIQMLGWQFAEKYLQKKFEGTTKKKKYDEIREALPEAVLEAKIIQTVEGEYWTVEQLCAYLKKQKKAEIYFAEKSTELSDLLAREGKRVFKMLRSGYYVNNYHQRILEFFAPAAALEKKYKSLQTSAQLSPEEQDFLDKISARVGNTALGDQISKVVAFYASDPAARALVHFRVYGNSQRDFYFYYSPDEKGGVTESKGSWKGKFKRLFQEVLYGTGSSSGLAVNFNHSYVRQLIRYETMTGNGFACNLLLQAMATESYESAHLGYKLVNQLFREEKKKQEKMNEKAEGPSLNGVKI